MKKNILKFTIFILLSLKFTVVFAVWYQVEMIVLENLYPDGDGETWHHQPELLSIGNTINLLPYQEIEETIEIEGTVGMVSENDLIVQVEIPITQDEGELETSLSLVPYAILHDDDYRLSGMKRILELSRDYRPLYHMSWQQPGLDNNLAKPVHIQAEDAYNLFEMTVPPALLSSEFMPANFYEPIRLAFDGTIKIRSSLYLYVDLDIVFFKPPPGVEGKEINSIIFDEESQDFFEVKDSIERVRLTESRRIKLNELHFFDHPLFGVILQVSRYETEE